MQQRHMRTIERALVTATVLSLALASHARAHTGHDDHSGEGLLGTPLLLTSAGLAAGALAVAGIALACRMRGRHATANRLALGACGLLALAAVAAAGSWYAGAGASASAGSSYGGTELRGVAHDFRLTDQQGRELALSDFRDRVVVLAFLDPNCSDVCPLTARHFMLVHERLGPDAADVALLAVNANPSASAVTDVAQATAKWGVDDIASWHFLTGPAAELEAVWQAYAVQAGRPKAGHPDEVAHSPGVYVIDQRGEKRWYISIPYGATSETRWEGPGFDELVLRHVRALLED